MLRVDIVSKQRVVLDALTTVQVGVKSVWEGLKIRERFYQKVLTMLQKIINIVTEAINRGFTGSLEIHFFQGKPISAHRHDKIDLT